MGGHVRAKWETRKDFYLSTAGSFIGLGNVWRFPYLCYENGGALFFIPYSLCLIFAGIPIFFLEVAVGQYTSEGAITAWGVLAPITTGIGYGGIALTTVINIYYIIVLAWAFYYMVASFVSSETLHQKWNSCDNAWNNRTLCRTIDEMRQNNTGLGGMASLNKNNKTFITPIEEYWENNVLRISDDMNFSTLTDFNWPVFLSVCITWLLCFLCICKGLKWTSKVASFTATFPVVMLLILLVRGLTLPGAMNGIKFFLVPKIEDFDKLSESKIWVDAATQVLYSYALCKGALLSLGSYNKFRTNSYRDVFILSCCNSGVSVISGFAIFSVLGFMAGEFGVEVDKVARSGAGLAFIAYPQAIMEMPGKAFQPVWAVAFFLMILLLGLDTQFVGLEAVATSITDLYPSLRDPVKRASMLGVMIAISAVLALPMCSPGGVYLFKLYDYYGASGFCLLFLSACHCIAVVYVYGGNKFWRNVTQMVGFEPSRWYCLLCWAIITPLFCLAITGLMIFKFKSLRYPRPLNKTFEYSAAQESIGWILGSLSMLPVPLIALYHSLVRHGKMASSLNEIIYNFKQAALPRDGRIQKIVFDLNRWPEDVTDSSDSLQSMQTFEVKS